MVNETIVRISEKSPEQVAYELFRHVAAAEKMTLGLGPNPSNTDRKWILDTYAECLQTVQNPYGRKGAD